MNKIIVDEEKVLSINNAIVFLEIAVKEVTINIKGTVLINDLINTLENAIVTINLAPGSSLVYNNFSKGKVKNQITINQENNSTVIYNYSLLVTDESSLKINVNIKGSNNNCKVNVKAVTKNKGFINVIATGDITKNVINNNYLENIRILMENDEENTILPNLFVSSNNIEAFHNATISSFSKEDLFYLNSKGLSEKLAKELIMKGFLINNLELNEENKLLITNML